MFFKNKLIFILASVLVVYVAACSLKTEEDAYKPEVVKIDKEFSCIDDVGVKFEKYLKGTIHSSEVVKFFDCAKDAMSMFKNNTRSKEGSSYSPEVLRKFLHKYFLKKNQISDSLLDEGMKIKVTMVGGDVNYLTKAEVGRGVELLEIIKQQALKALPFMKFYNSDIVYKIKNFSMSSINELEQSFVALQDIARALGAELEKNRFPYAFESFKKFLEEFLKFLNFDDPVYKSKDKDSSLIKWVELVKQFKSMLFDTNNLQMQPDEWTPFLQQAMGWYSVSLRYKYTIEDSEDGAILEFPGLGSMQRFGKSIEKLTREAISFHADKLITYPAITKLIYALDRVGKIPSGIQAKTLEYIIPIYVKRSFVDVKKPFKERKNPGITVEVVDNLFKEFDIWYEVQRSLSTYKQSDGSLKYPPSIMRMDINNCIQKSNPTRNVDPKCELLRIKNERPMFNADFLTAFLVQDSVMLKKDPEFINMSYLNVVRVAVRLLILSFGSYDEAEIKRTLNQRGIKKSEMSAFYDESHMLGVDLGFMDPINSGGGSRSFMEGKLFTYASKGYRPEDADDLLTYTELTQLLSQLYSGGRLGLNIFNDMLDDQSGDKENDKQGVCRESGKLDGLDNPTIHFKCFDENLKTYLVPAVQALPGMYKHLSALPDVEFNELKREFYKAVFEVDCKSDDTDLDKSKCKYVESGNLTFLMTVMHYIETTMTHFDDHPKDGVMDFHEANLALEVYRTLFEEVVEAMSPSGLGDEDEDEGSEKKKKKRKHSKRPSTASLANAMPSDTSEDSMLASYFNKFTSSIRGDSDEDGVVVKNTATIEVKKSSWKAELVKAAFYTILTDAEVNKGKIFRTAAWHRFRGKYSDDIAEMRIDRSQLIKVFVLIVSQIKALNEGKITPIKEEDRNPYSIAP